MERGAVSLEVAGKEGVSVEIRKWNKYYTVEGVFDRTVDVDFEVGESETEPGLDDFHPDALIGQREYRFLHGYSTASALAAMCMKQFPGVEGGDLYYASESGLGKGRPDLNKILADRLHRVGGRVLEIGGQQGKFFAQVADLLWLRYKDKAKVDIIDLFLQRKYGWPQSGEGRVLGVDYFPPIRYFQGDSLDLPLIAAEEKLPKYDAVLMVLVTGVLFDPLLVLRRVWDRLKIGGEVLVYDPRIGEGDGVKMPLLVNGESVSREADYLLKERAKGWYQRERDRYLGFWKENCREIVARIPGGPFSYDSRTSVESEQMRDIAELSGAIRKMEKLYLIDFDLATVLRHMGVEVSVFHGKSRQGHDEGTLVAIKKTKEENPFEAFKAYGFWARPFHTQSYLHPQVIRAVTL